MKSRAIIKSLSGAALFVALGGIASAQMTPAPAAPAQDPAAGAIIERPYLEGRLLDPASSDANFRALDHENRGYLSRAETAYMSGFDFAAADRNGDGRLSADEFDQAWPTYNRPQSTQ